MTEQERPGWNVESEDMKKEQQLKKVSKHYIHPLVSKFAETEEIGLANRTRGSQDENKKKN